MWTPVIRTLTSKQIWSVLPSSVTYAAIATHSLCKWVMLRMSGIFISIFFLTFSLYIITLCTLLRCVFKERSDCPVQPEYQAMRSSTIKKTRPLSIIHQIHASSVAAGWESGEILVKLLSCDEFCRWWPAKSQYQWYGGVGACMWLSAALCLSKQHQLFVSLTLSTV